MTKRNYLPWERDFIYLAYPLFSNREIADILNRKKECIQVYASTKRYKKIPFEGVKKGDIFNKLTVQKYIPGRDGREGKWLCECKCGQNVKIPTWCLTSKHSTSCGCGRIDAISWKGKIGGSWYNRTKNSAKSRKLEFNISVEYLEQLFKEQNYKCAISGLDLYIEKVRGGKGSTASLDRIDSTKGYIEGNVQFLHKDVNYMKWAFKQDYFIEMCRIINEYQTSI